MAGGDEDDTIEAATQAAVAEAFAEYEARERAARATTSRGAAALPINAPMDPFAEETPVMVGRDPPRGSGSVITRAPDELERLRGWLAEARTADYFALLGLTPRATDGSIERAYAAARQTLDAMGSSRAIDEARALLDEARDILAEPSTRAAYARHVGEQKPVTIFWLPMGARDP